MGEVVIGLPILVLVHGVVGVVVMEIRLVLRVLRIEIAIVHPRIVVVVLVMIGQNVLLLKKGVQNRVVQYMRVIQGEVSVMGH